jgi:hypothetical protein
VVDPVQSTYVTSLVLEASDRFKGSTVTISALGHWFLGARARRFSDCHQQNKANSDMGAATTARRRLAPATVLVVRWSKDVNVIFMMFGLPYTSCKLLEYIHIFLAKKKRIRNRTGTWRNRRSEPRHARGHQMGIPVISSFLSSSDGKSVELKLARDNLMLPPVLPIRIALFRQIYHSR